MTKKQIFAALAISCALAGCGGGGTVPGVPPVPPAPVTTTTAFGVEVHPGDALSTSQTALADMRKNLGVTTIRTDYSPTQFSYGWVANAIAAGLKMVMITPYLAIGAPFDPTGYAAICAQGAAQFPGQTWEIMNEPDNEVPLNEQQITPAQYVTLVQAVVPAIRAADPTAKIITGGTSGLDMGWLTAIAAAYPLVDGVGVHPYGIAPNGMAQAIAQAQSVTGGKPVYLSEWGLAAPPSGSIATAVSSAKGRTPLFVYYEYRTQPGEPSFGLVGTPGYAEYQSAIR